MGIEGALALDQKLMVIKPTSGNHQHLDFVWQASAFGTQGLYKGAILMLCHPAKAQGMFGQLLVLEKSTSAPVQSVEGGQFRCANTDLPAQMVPQRDGYVVNELDSTVLGCSFEADTGILKPLQVLSSLPDTFTGNSRASEIAVSEDGRTLYAVIAGADLTGFADFH